VHGLYLALDDNLNMELTETFLELWLGMGGKYVAILSSGLVILENRCEYASCGSYELAPIDWQSWVVASDV